MGASRVGLDLLIGNDPAAKLCCAQRTQAIIIFWSWRENDLLYEEFQVPFVLSYNFSSNNGTQRITVVVNRQPTVLLIFFDLLFDFK